MEDCILKYPIYLSNFSRALIGTRHNVGERRGKENKGWSCARTIPRFISNEIPSNLDDVYCLFLYRSELECGELGCGELGCGESSTEHWSTNHTRTAGVRVLSCVWIYWVPSLKEQCSDYIKNWCNMFGLIGQDQLKEPDHCARTLQYHSNTLFSVPVIQDVLKRLRSYSSSSLWSLITFLRTTYQ